jgi:hypothetical protein
MVNYDKAQVKEQLGLDNVFDLLTEWGGDPEYTSFGIVSATICHNHPGEGSRKLYFYENSKLFKCYTGCDETFDIFELAIKVADLQGVENFDLNTAVRLVAFKCGIQGTDMDMEDLVSNVDWKILNNYDRIQSIETKDYHITLKEYDSDILDRLNYTVKIGPWLREGISQEAMDNARIGFFPGGDQISIPHYDADGRFVGLRGRSLCAADSERFGKYRPIFVNQQFYSHPLGMNLYNLNNSKDNIKLMGKAIVFESEKSCLLYQSYFGIENDISVACCGSNLSIHQVQLLLDAGAKEIVVAFDRQFQEVGDDEFKHLTRNLTKLNTKYKNEALISFMFDKNKITGYKASPIDEGKEKFLTLFKERILL